MLWARAGRHNRPVTKPAVVFLIASIGAGAASPAAAQGIVRWLDAQGRPHYSNRGGAGASDSGGVSGAQGGEQGWESVLERREGEAELGERAEAAINSLELQVTRKNRERAHAEEDLETTRAGIVRALASRSPELPTLKAREATEITALRKLDLEIGLLKLRIAKLRALKEAERQRRTAP